MAKAQNIVILGEYKDSKVLKDTDNKIYISYNNNKIYINKEVVETIETQKMQKINKGLKNIAIATLIATFFPVTIIPSLIIGGGLFAGLSLNGDYIINLQVNFKDGKSSILEIDAKISSLLDILFK